MYTIKEFSAMTGLPKSKIRFYERYGLFENERGDNNYRYYTEMDAFRVNTFRRLVDLGFSVEEATVLLRQGTYSEVFQQLLEKKHKELEKQKETLCKQVDLIQEIMENVKVQHSSTFEVCEVEDYIYARASMGNDFSVSMRNKEEIAALESISAFSCNSRIISIEDFLSEDELTHPTYVVSIPKSEFKRVENSEVFSHMHELTLGKVLKYKRRISRKESLYKESFLEAMNYIHKHGYTLRGDIFIIPSFVTLDDDHDDIETIFIPIK